MNKNLSRALMMTFAAALVTVTVGAAASFAAGPSRNCLDVWQPVICSNGVVYSNACYAARAGATGCVPWGGDDI